MKTKIIYYIGFIILLLVSTNPSRDSLSKKIGQEYYKKSGEAYFPDCDGTSSGGSSYNFWYKSYFLFTCARSSMTTGRQEIEVVRIQYGIKMTDKHYEGGTVTKSNYIGVLGFWIYVGSDNFWENTL